MRNFIDVAFVPKVEAFHDNVSADNDEIITALAEAMPAFIDYLVDFLNAVPALTTALQTFEDVTIREWATQFNGSLAALMEHWQEWRAMKSVLMDQNYFLS